jgi:hypothetical protein
VREEDTAAAPLKPGGSRRTVLIVGLAALVILAAVAAVGWRYFAVRQTIPDWDRLSALELSAPIGDAFRVETPWARMILAPARPGETNTLEIALLAPRGTPEAGTIPTPRVTGLTAQALSTQGAPQDLALEAGVNGVLHASAQLDGAGWWRFSLATDDAQESVDFYDLLPDPNVNGPNAVADSNSSPEGEALFQRGMAATAALRTVRFTQWIADGRGNAALSEHAVTAGGDGTPVGFSYRAAGGMEAIVIGTTRWVRLPGNPGWQRQEGTAAVPPSEWGEEYFGATGFTLLGTEDVDGERCQLLAFVVPELTEPRRQTVAWYLWWVGEESGHVRREAMVSRLHYMLNEFSDFDAPLQLVPPDLAATPMAGTPLP